MPLTDKIEDQFLEKLRAGNIATSIFLTNGIKLYGSIIEFDDEVIIFQNSVNQMIFKRAISTIVPAH